MTECNEKKELRVFFHVQGTKKRQVTVTFLKYDKEVGQVWHTKNIDKTTLTAGICVEDHRTTARINEDHHHGPEVQQNIIHTKDDQSQPADPSTRYPPGGPLLHEILQDADQWEDHYTTKIPGNHISDTTENHIIQQKIDVYPP